MPAMKRGMQVKLRRIKDIFPQMPFTSYYPELLINVIKLYRNLISQGTPLYLPFFPEPDITFFTA
jgi:hypothetical protein